MIFVSVEAIKSDGRCSAVGNGWHDTESIAEAVELELGRFDLGRFDRMWQWLGHGAAVTYVITVAPESSPKRTRTQNWPLPVDAD